MPIFRLPGPNSPSENPVFPSEKGVATGISSIYGRFTAVQADTFHSCFDSGVAFVIFKRMNLLFQQLFDAQSSTYTYLLADGVSKEAVIIDPVLDMIERDLNLVRELGLKLKYVLDTHIHADHVTASGRLRKETQAQIGVSRNANVTCADLKLGDGDEVTFGPFKIRILETPGHTNCSVSYVCEDKVFTGDTLLIRGCGRTDFQQGSAEKLYDSVTRKLFKLPLDMLVYPGHDYNGLTSSSIAMEMKHNPRLGQAKTKDEFKTIMANLHLPYPKMIDVALPANHACGIPKV
jgi:sulfur dioxygenase